MKADFDDIVGKRMPYVETEEYIDQLVDRCATSALAGQRAARAGLFSRSLSAVTAVAAAAVAVVAIFTTLLADNSPGTISPEAIAKSQSLGNVLSELSNDELSQLDYYTFDYVSDEYADTYEEE